MLGFFAPVAPAGGRIVVDLDGVLGLAMRASAAAHTSLDVVLRWPWHKMLAVWAEGEAMHEETWGLLLGVWYKRKDDV